MLSPDVEGMIHVFWNPEIFDGKVRTPWRDPSDKSPQVSTLPIESVRGKKT